LEVLAFLGGREVWGELVKGVCYGEKDFCGKVEFGG